MAGVKDDVKMMQIQQKDEQQLGWEGVCVWGGGCEPNHRAASNSNNSASTAVYDKLDDDEKKFNLK